MRRKCVNPCNPVFKDRIGEIPRAKRDFMRLKDLRPKYYMCAYPGIIQQNLLILQYFDHI